jgi:hypothetical protein
MHSCNTNDASFFSVATHPPATIAPRALPKPTMAEQAAVGKMTATEGGGKW